ncbi:Na(+)/H(+) antiporter subunit B [Haliovirga abyssi]|uniref:Cation:proton antiporter n=1 Tax=Haliovirga abyssi TaxID=2996794 RepID=A0AAU9DWP7_9FUSO|nr:Na(+)/H(+) antiporter subunit B [Haliovirga abyssi]BDU50731.1 cation:proton antiporter [Haliovirga abyssi]
MKKIGALLIVILFGYFIFSNLYLDSSKVKFNKYGEANISQSVSNKFLNKNVNGNNESIRYGKNKDLESGSANVVTSIVVNYRSFDTLGEVTVLFVSALGVALLLGGVGTKLQFAVEPNFIVKAGVKVIVGLMFIVGVYIFVHGHLTPGGGFPGGSMLASIVLLLYVSHKDFQAKVHSLKLVEGIAGSLYVIIGLTGILLGGAFLYNFLPTGTIGNLFSAGIIPIIYVLVGLKVGAELSGIIVNFISGEVE